MIGIMSNRPVHFEIHVDNPERAIKFYQDVFDWKFQKWGPDDKPYWMVMTADKGSKEPGINGGLLPRPKECKPLESGAALNAYACTMQVENIDEIIKKIEAAGGKLAMPKFALSGMAWQAYYIDTEGNIFGIHQPDVNAK